ncbi:hypothetical protein [Hyphomicrobium sulfonivorans]|uniref:hypothetical protein n=1 Tax=Hyphomicrobium sulfonivorans TaxID=121290 RepID=UPI00156F5477|nr:hypothetical protein [Hyphomicrobium sulfonivorans]MBI1648336.1 hypothetical protein [Hyphomicrobium sulfonivorans]NSL71129.1 hypothetical protein [Hyphomicrobium sulfonivorans]
MTVQRIATTASAAALIAASAGFGAFYAWTTGNHHGPVIGALSVCMAIGLEAAKPFAIEGVFTALRSWSPIRAAALAVLGVVAVTYSLTAELSLMAASRADASATRSQAAIAADAAKARYDAARHELATLPVTRPIAALEAEIARLKTTPRLAPCDDTGSKAFGKVSRKVCGEIAALTAEAATTARRTELQTALAAAESDLASAPLATDADPAAAALVTYLGALGVDADAAELSRWLALVPVLALEIGSSFAVLLAGGTHPVPSRPKGVPDSVSRTALKGAAEAIASDLPPLGTVPAPAEDAAQRAVSEASSAQPDGAPAGALKDTLLEHLKEHGGAIRTGQRGLAKALGTSTSELNRTLHALAAAGVIALSTAPTGTELRLVA